MKICFEKEFLQKKAALKSPRTDLFHGGALSGKSLQERKEVVPNPLTHTAPVPKVFISYSHLDKRVARRLFRRLAAHGIKVWFDQLKLRFGAFLTSSIRSQIEDSDALLVIASQASADSTWVGLELDFAREHGKTIIPFFIESLAKHERFRDFLGVDAVSQHAFADCVQNLMRNLFLSYDMELPPTDPAVLMEGLRALAREEPDLKPLIIGCLDSEGLHQENMDTAFNVAFHSLDEALNSLYDLKRDENIAYHAAYGFCYTGAGVRALSLWIDDSGDGGLPLVIAVGKTTLQPPLISTAIRLLGACDPPNNHALYCFINNNSSQFDHTQRRSVIRLVTWPVRTDTTRMGDTLGRVALEHFPNATEIQQMWIRWVHAGAFDGKTSSPMDLARYLSDAKKGGLPGWDLVGEALRSHVRALLRSKDRGLVFVAINHIQAAADTGAPVLGPLLREAQGVSATAEWDDWRKGDRVTAEWMKWYVNENAKEAAGDRNWIRALEGTNRMVEFEELRRRILEMNEQGPNGGEEKCI